MAMRTAERFTASVILFCRETSSATIPQRHIRLCWEASRVVQRAEAEFMQRERWPSPRAPSPVIPHRVATPPLKVTPAALPGTPAAAVFLRGALLPFQAAPSQTIQQWAGNLDRIQVRQAVLREAACTREKTPRS